MSLQRHHHLLSVRPLPLPRKQKLKQEPKKIETKPRGEEAYAWRSKDGTWTQENNRSYFGYKLHTKDDLSTGFISAFEVTTASVNDNKVDLTKKGEPCVRDRGYTDPGKGLCLSMIRAKAGKPLPEKNKEMNKFISKVRAPSNTRTQ